MKVVVAVVAIALVLVAASSDEPTVAATAIAGAVILAAVLALSEVFPRLKRGTVKGPGQTEFSFELEERQAAADAASEEAPAELERRITSEDEGPPLPSADDATVVGTLNYQAGSIALFAIFDFVSDGPLAGCELRLYLPDADDGMLRCVPPEGTSPWSPGQGAVGEAFKDGKFVLACGAAVSDGTHHLDDQQQQRYRNLAAVAATPIFNATGTVLGVVSAATSDLQHALENPDAKRDLELAALLISRILVELLQWFPDA